jgi:hypothetical protein
VEHGSGIIAQPHAVDGHLGVAGRPDGRGAFESAMHNGVLRPDTLTLEDDGTPRRGAYDGISGGDRYASATDFELHHGSDPKG